MNRTVKLLALATAVAAVVSVRRQNKQFDQNQQSQRRQKFKEMPPITEYVVDQFAQDLERFSDAEIQEQALTDDGLSGRITP